LEQSLSKVVQGNDLDARIKAFFGRDVDKELVGGDEEQWWNGTMIYLNDVQRRRCKLTFRAGLAWRYPYTTAQLRPNDVAQIDLVRADTSGLGILVERNGQRETTANFVVGHDRELYMTEHMEAAVSGKSFKHSSYFDGKRALFAGGIVIRDGWLKYVNNTSGHYKPTRLELVDCLQVLQAKGVRLEKVLVHDWEMPSVPGNEIEKVARADVYLMKRSRWSDFDLENVFIATVYQH
jgi:hypothetical protein